MREAMGSTLLIKILLIFLGIYIAFLAIAVNYSQSFRVKNKIVSIIEEYEGYPGHNNEVKKIIDNFLAGVGYAPGRMKNKDGDYNIVAMSTDRGTYYVVTTYIVFDFPLVKDALKFPIKGETRVFINK